MTARQVAIVVPCFNEEKRLRLDHFLSFAEKHTSVKFLFVDDGSTDSTGVLLREATGDHPGLGSVLSLGQNLGKGEAVRNGLRHALEEAPWLVGYWDADLATPLQELPPMIGCFEEDEDLQGLLGSRVRMLGRSIERRPTRHYLGRVFATAASMVLGLPVYDTQCGAKLFRATEELGSILELPFHSRWIFDVEILARFKERWPSDAGAWLREFPIHRWQDVGGSRLTPRDFFRAVADLAGIWRRLVNGRSKEK